MLLNLRIKRKNGVIQKPQVSGHLDSICWIKLFFFRRHPLANASTNFLSFFRIQLFITNLPIYIIRFKTILNDFQFYLECEAPKNKVTSFIPPFETLLL